MAGGLRYETGRDMPPGMIEKAAVKIARDMEQGVTTPQSACAADSECCGMPATGRHEDNGFAARSATPDKGSLQGERIASPAEQARNDSNKEKLIKLLCKATFGVNKQTIESYLIPSAIAEVADQLIANGVTAGKPLEEYLHPIINYAGLKSKYLVFNAASGRKVENCFVLRPDKDTAAVEALRAYAHATDNKMLSNDIYNWVGKGEADYLISAAAIYQRALDLYRTGEVDDQSLNDIINLIDDFADITGSRWIPVGERKPDFELQMWRQEHETEPLQVLVTIKDAREATILSYDEDGDFFAVDDYGDVEIYNVTHWQALPAVPEVAE